MKFYYLTQLQKMDISITTVMFSLFIGFLRPIIINQDINTKNIITYALIFFAWYGCTMILSNAFIYQYEYNKLVLV
jgi:hypothetical protein